jgi:hypothetical protein
MTLTDPDIWRAANLLIRQHGQDAPIHAAQRTDELMAAGDIDGWSVWKRICAAVDELMRDELEPGERVN